MDGAWLAQMPTSIAMDGGEARPTNGFTFSRTHCCISVWGICGHTKAHEHGTQQRMLWLKECWKQSVWAVAQVA